MFLPLPVITMRFRWQLCTGPQDQPMLSADYPPENVVTYTIQSLTTLHPPNDVARPITTNNTQLREVNPKPQLEKLGMAYQRVYHINAQTIRTNYLNYQYLMIITINTQ